MLGPSGIGVIKTTVNIGIYFPRVFHMRSGPNQSYSMEYGWEHLSLYSKWKVKGRTSKLNNYKNYGMYNETQFT